MDHALVRGFGKTNNACASGPGATANGVRPATFARRLWRFGDNDRVGFLAGIAPLAQCVRDAPLVLHGSNRPRSPQWRIETFHKQLQAAGRELEKWLQRNGDRGVGVGTADGRGVPRFPKPV